MFRTGFILLSVFLLIAACSPAAQSSVTATPTSRFATVVGSITPRPLPPSWTPSPTPTITPTPTSTATPTLMPTLSETDICAGFELLNQPSGRYVYEWDDYMPLIVVLQDRSSMIHFQATHRQSGELTGFEMVGGQAIGVSVFMNAMPRPGTYDWTLSARTTTYGDICQISGSFFALRPTTPLPEATEDIEPESGADDSASE